jgi:hypothetical protein
MDLNYIKQSENVNKFHIYTLEDENAIYNVKYLSEDKHQEAIYNEYS